MDTYYVTFLCPDGTWAELFLTEEEAGKLDAFCAVTLRKPLVGADGSVIEALKNKVESKIAPVKGSLVEFVDNSTPALPINRRVEVLFMTERRYTAEDLRTGQHLSFPADMIESGKFFIPGDNDPDQKVSE